MEIVSERDTSSETCDVHTFVKLEVDIHCESGLWTLDLETKMSAAIASVTLSESYKARDVEGTV